jgi:hypothetical protein
MTIYGAASPEVALQEARYSLDAGEESYIILGLQAQADDATPEDKP